MRLANRTIMAAFASVLIALVSGCASSADQIDNESPLTADNIGERVASALREAETFSFEWTATSYGEGEEPQNWTGAIEYGDDGEVEELSLNLPGAEEYRLVDDTLYERTGDGSWSEVEGEERSDLIRAWDWADVAEDMRKIKNFSNEGAAEINGVPTTEYQFDTKETTVTWWLDDENRIVKWKDEESGGILTDYGEPVDISPPE